MWGKLAFGLNSTLTLIGTKPWFTSGMPQGRKMHIIWDLNKTTPRAIADVSLCLGSSISALAATL